MSRKNIKEAIKEYFCTNPTAKLRVRHIERELRLPLPSVIRYVRELEKETFLKRTKTANVVFYSADRSSKSFILEKKLFNIGQLYSSGIIDFLRNELSNPPVAIFGSYAKGEDTESSDIDIYIQTPSKRELHLKRFENILKRRIQVFSYKELAAISNPFLANNILNGIVVNGFLEVFK